MNDTNRAMPQQIGTPHEREQRLAKTLTEPQVIEAYYRSIGENVRAITTDNFLNKSRNEYNAPWLVREIVQNFVDANPDHPGTLNGVDIEEQQLPNGEVKFTIRGHWPFEKPDALITLDSEKPTDRESSGGNGIGLKQTAVRLMRDFGVIHFTITGNDWVLTYRMESKEQLNHEINEEHGRQGQALMNRSIRKDWLVGHLDHLGDAATPQAMYEIVTADPAMIRALRTMREIGVSQTNPYLLQPDYKNAHGIIKWLLPQSVQEHDQGLIRGRLFINGQVMNFKDKGTDEATDWQGPEGVTIALENLAYRMSIDRPPVNLSEFRQYIRSLVESMSRTEILDQLRCSEPLWTKLDTQRPFDESAASTLIQKLLNQLYYSRDGYTSVNYAADFPSRPYLANDRLNEEQIALLNEQGFVILPRFFKQLGMPLASSKLEQFDQLKRVTPNSYEAKCLREKAAETAGIEVDFEDCTDLTTAEKLLTAILTRLKDRISTIDTTGNKVHIIFNQEFSDRLLVQPFLTKKGIEQDALRFLRGVIEQGLRSGMILEKSAVIASGETVVTFTVAWDYETDESSLIARRLKSTTHYQPLFEFALRNDIDLAPLTMQTNGSSGHSGLKLPGSEESATNRSLKDLPPVKQPERPVIESTGEIIPVEASPKTPQAEAVLQALPALQRAVEVLDAAVPKVASVSHRQTKKSPIDEYLTWRTSEDFYAVAAGYMTGRHLAEIVAHYHRAKVPSKVEVLTNEHAAEQLAVTKFQQVLQTIMNRVTVDGDKSIDDFEIVIEPTPTQLAQLATLRTIVNIAGAVAIPNELFLYGGTGSYGINIDKRAIGIHTALLKTSLAESLQTMVHEVTHNEAMDHGLTFRQTEESLFTAILEHLLAVLQKTISQEPLTDKERALYELSQYWNQLQKPIQDAQATI
ncbi:hypothetical protein HY524_01240 [Candidatus Berkelbacteria bacterium]|nr:hypothetical protein [Candidatus Berkelbacteria bacterium]